VSEMFAFNIYDFGLTIIEKRLTMCARRHSHYRDPSNNRTRGGRLNDNRRTIVIWIEARRDLKVLAHLTSRTIRLAQPGSSVWHRVFANLLHQNSGIQVIVLEVYLDYLYTWIRHYKSKLHTGFAVKGLA